MTVYISADWQDTINCFAARRHNKHRHDPCHRVLATDYWRKGLTGEVAFGLTMGLTVDLADRPKGDGGIDFEIGSLKIDVKTTGNPDLGLLLPVTFDKADEKRRAMTALVLCHYQAADTAVIVGWMFDGKARKYNANVVTGRGPLNHIVPKHHLEPLDTLKAHLQKAKQSVVDDSFLESESKLHRG